MSYRTERDRGVKEYRQQLAELREKWPLAFPVNDKDIRPLTVDATREIAAAKGWSLPYTLGVLSRWKMAPVYCQSILCYDQRIALDGTPAEPVDAEARGLAAKQLAKLAAHKAAKTTEQEPLFHQLHQCFFRKARLTRDSIPQIAPSNGCRAHTPSHCGSSKSSAIASAMCLGVYIENSPRIGVRFAPVDVRVIRLRK